MIISQTLTDMVQVTISIIWKVIYGLSNGIHLTFVHSESQGQGHPHFDSEYLGNGDSKKNLTISIKSEGMHWLSVGVSTFDLDTFSR